MTELDPTTTPETNPDPYEPAVDAAPATAVTPPATMLPRRPARWPIALALAAVVIVVSAAVALLITGQAPKATVLGYVPADSIMYGEARLDLPGDQRTALASFLSKFPGFADQAAIESKLDQVLDEFIVGATNGDQSYVTDIKPWFDGEVAFSVGALPDPSALSGSDPSGMNGFHFLVLVSVKDEAGMTTWFKGLASSSGASTSEETYNGANLTLLSSGNGPQEAFAVLGGKVAVVGDVDSVKAAVDTKGNGPFAAQADLKAALAATDSDHVGFMYLAIGPLLDWASQVSQASGPSNPLGMDLSTSIYGAILPDWEAVALRIEGDAVVLETVTDAPDQAIGPTDNRSSAVTDHVPASAVVVSVGHDVGPTIVSALKIYRSDPSLKAVVESFDDAVGGPDGADGMIGWIGDVAVVVNQAATNVEGGLIIVPTDRNAADGTLTSLRALLALGGSQEITITDTPYAGATITTIDLGDISSLAGLAGAAGLPPEVLGGGSGLLSGHMELAYAITDQIVVIGSGPEFVKHVLDTTSATSLASTDRYKALVGRVGTGTGSLFIDITAIRGSIETLVAAGGPTSVASYEQNVKPFLAPFDAVIQSSAVKDGLNTDKFIVTVK